MSGQKIELGPKGKLVAARIRQIREMQRLSYTDLSRIVTENGRALSPLAIRRIEDGIRRVDVDDLHGIAEALKIPASELMAASPLVHHGEYVFSKDDTQRWMALMTTPLLVSHRERTERPDGVLTPEGWEAFRKKMDNIGRCPCDNCKNAEEES